MATQSVCYYCGLPLTSGKNGNKTTEHIPPRMMFQAFPHTPITVPSCPIHNHAKSGQDQAIIAGFMKALDAGNYNLSPDVTKAIQHEKTKSTFDRTKHTAQLKSLFKNPTGKQKKQPKVTRLNFLPYDWFRQITAGLVFDATQKYDPTINWQAAIVYSPNWGEGDEGLTNDEYIAMRKIDPIWQDTRWLDGWSSYPSDIYRFYVGFEKPILFKHIFYNSYTWYVVFECSEATRQPLGHKVLETNGL